MLSRRQLVTGAMATMAFGQTGSRRVLALFGDRYRNPDYIRLALTKMF